MIHLHHRNETPKPCFDDVLGGAFEIAKTVLLCDSVNGGNLFTLIPENMSTFGRNKNLATLAFGNPFIPLHLDRQILMVR